MDSEPPQVINAWPEIYTGHLYWLRRALPPPDELLPVAVPQPALSF